MKSVNLESCGGCDFLLNIGLQNSLTVLPLAELFDIRAKIFKDLSSELISVSLQLVL